MAKRKSQANASPPAHPSAIPPQLPPSVEEAYRRKCMELKQRSKEVDDVNDATRLRISRLKRQVDKLRVERAFLLEQLAKRTSTNVEDSDGSPSPPPTPEDKPLRIKRGHRKSSVFDKLEANQDAGSTFIPQHLAASFSPGYDSFPRNGDKDGNPKDTTAHSSQAATNDISFPIKVLNKPPTAYEMYADELRAKQPSLDDDVATKDIDEEIAASWKELPEEEKEPFVERAQAELEKYQEEAEKFEAQKHKEKAAKNGISTGNEKAKDQDADVDSETNSTKAEPSKDEDESGTKTVSNRSPQDEDVEMGNDDTEPEV